MSITLATPEPLPTYGRSLVWFRRDLRAHDHAALYYALKSSKQVFAVFVFDTDILQPLPRADRRVEFIHGCVAALDRDLSALMQQYSTEAAPAGRVLAVLHGRAAELVPKLAAALQVQAVFCNHDDEPAALARDGQVRGALANKGISLHTYKDHTVFERSELLNQSNKPYTVFTPYKNAWLKKVDDFYLRSYRVEHHAAHLAALPPEHAPALPALQDLDFLPTNLAQVHITPGTAAAHALLDDFLTRIDRYREARDFPAVKGVSYLSVHIRFGTVSIRQLAHIAYSLMLAGNQGAATWLSELIWRDFYCQILAHFPHVVGKSFKPEYEAIKWEKGKAANAAYAAWCAGKTGYPLVDAAMRQLNQTGYMHNRLRMVTASFLTKHLGLDWRRGEAYFAQQLNDFDLAANNGGWQWAASTGCDAQPYFRIFNPISQSQKFDPQGKFIRRYVPELAGLSDTAIHTPWLASEIELAAAAVVLGDAKGANYPLPIVDHAQARELTLARYAVVKQKP